MDSDDQTRNQLPRREFMGLSAGLGVAALAGLAASRSARAGVMTDPNLKNLISVIDFGADPSGVADSTVAIQNAIYSAMNPAFVPGGAFSYPTTQGESAVFFPSGKYKITNTLHITGADYEHRTNNISLIGMRAAIVQYTAGIDIIRIENAEHCMLKDLYLSASASSGHGISLINAPRTVLENVEVYLVGGNCLRADDSFWLSAYDCVFSRPGVNQYAVYHLDNMNNVSYYHCRFAGVSGTLDRGGLFTAEAAAGLGVTAVVACDFSFCKVGLKLHAGCNFYVANCYMEDTQTGVMWGHSDGSDPVTGQYFASTWPQGGTIETCFFSDTVTTHAPVFIDVQRGTNLRINNPVFMGNNNPSTSPNKSTGIRINNSVASNLNQRIVIDDTPYYQGVSVIVDDPSGANGPRLKRVSTQPY